jgi:MFS family permease
LTLLFVPKLVGKVTVLMLWMRPIGGFLGDKFGKSSILIFALGLSVTFLLVISVSPITLPHLYFNVLVVLSGLLIYTIRGLYWSLLGDCKIDEKKLGLAIGVISFVGYLPDILMPIVNIVLFKTYGDNAGYNAYFIFCACAGIIGILITLIFKRSVKKNSININETPDLITKNA